MFAGGMYLGLSAKQGSLVEYFSMGSLRGLNACMSNTASSALSNEEVRNVCASKHARNLTSQIPIDGVGSAVEADPGRYSFRGSITNGHHGYVVTYAQVRLSVFDSSGEKTDHEAYGNVWATPFDGISIQLPFARQLADEIMQLGWCDHEVPNEDRKSCKSWEFSRIGGVSI